MNYFQKQSAVKSVNYSQSFVMQSLCLKVTPVAYVDVSSRRRNWLRFHSLERNNNWCQHQICCASSEALVVLTQYQKQLYHSQLRQCNLINARESSQKAMNRLNNRLNIQVFYLSLKSRRKTIPAIAVTLLSANVWGEIKLFKTSNQKICLPKFG